MPKTKKRIQVNTRLDDELDRRLEAYCEAHDHERTRGQVLRMALARYLADEGY